jgi:UDP-GlcNAc:undecaprenyl-phosphate GlcNAc-1-phosphate transferase
MDHPGERKIHAEPIPLAGGLAVLSGLLVGMLALAGWLLRNPASVTDGSTLGPIAWLAIAGGAVAMTILGLLDDRHELGAGAKFAGQFLIALGVAAAGVRVTLFLPYPVLHYAITVLWILTLINAFNFMDNMNGLCSGLGIIAAGSFALAAWQQGQGHETLFGLVICGALLGFLPFNFPKAKAFLGDSGSHLVGYCIAVLAILPHFSTEQAPKPYALLKPLLILAVPLVDLAWVVALRTLAGKPFYIGDTNHFSHRLVRRGLGKTAAVGVIWAIALACGILAAVL